MKGYTVTTTRNGQIYSRMHFGSFGDADRFQAALVKWAAEAVRAPDEWIVKLEHHATGEMHVVTIEYEKELTE